MNLIRFCVATLLLISVLFVEVKSIPVLPHALLNDTETLSFESPHAQPIASEVTVLPTMIYRASKQPVETARISSFQALQREFRLEGGLVEVLEWLFVALLVAPGTFPLLTCIFMTCTSVVHRISAQVSIDTARTV